MIKTCFPTLFFALFLFSCAEKEEPKSTFISGQSIIEKDIQNIDTSLFSIMRLDIIDSSRTDTSYILRENFRHVAQEFLDLPDITDKKNKKNYTETSLYDESTGKVIISYIPVAEKKLTLQRQDVAVVPDMSGGESDITSIYFDYVQVSKDSSIEKKMLWLVNRSFQITTLRQLPGKPETITTTKVIWNEPAY